MNVEDYAERLLQETIAAADSRAEGAVRSEVFTDLIAGRLIDTGEFDQAQVASYRARGVDVSGWSYDEADPTTLRLFVTDYRAEVPAPSLSATAIALAFRRLTEFFVRCLDGYGDHLEESSAAFELGELIGRQRNRFERLRLYLFSDARAREPNVKDVVVRNVQVSHHVWDLERLHRLDTSGLEHEPIAVDLVDRLGGPLPCLVGPPESDHQVFLAIVPAELLASLYSEFGSRLLERNVRAFLQIRGIVNRGIRSTLQNEPARFLAYNNGVAATASKVSLVDLVAGGAGIGEISDLQIVNGGQTMASLESATRRDKVDLSDVAVQMKLTVVGEGGADEMVPFISKYSNTQNKVTGADFSANHPYHVRLEELSRTVWAPAADGSQRQTHWFYERARGQYADEHQRARTPAKQRQFKLMNPPSQKFTKTDLAKFVNSWDQRPHLVCLGAEKNFLEFMLELDESGAHIPEVTDFERIVAMAVLFRATEKVVFAQGFRGYRANIVTYTIAKLVHSTAHRIDLSQIWHAQGLSSALSEAIAELSHPINEVIQDPRGRTSNVGEWTKKLDCWKLVEEVPWDVPNALRSELVALGAASARAEVAGGTRPTAEQSESMSEIDQVTAETWFALANWAKVTGNLQGWQRQIAFGIGRRVGKGTPASPKQAVQGAKMLREARRLGFDG